MDLTKLNKIALLEDFLPTKKLSDLKVPETYKVTDLRQVTTKYGLKAIASLDDNCQVFLPRRLSDAFEKDPIIFDQMAHMVANGELYLKYLGGPKNQIEFNIGNNAF